MEDQQPAAGDLTEESPDSTLGGATAVDTDVAEAEAAHVDPDVSDDDDENADAATEDDEAADAEAADEPVVVRFRERRPATKWSVIAAAVAAALFVGSAAFAGATMQPYLTDRATVATKLNVARTAANAITTLWTYNAGEHRQAGRSGIAVPQR